MGSEVEVNIEETYSHLCKGAGTIYFTLDCYKDKENMNILSACYANGFSKIGNRNAGFLSYTRKTQKISTDLWLREATMASLLMRASMFSKIILAFRQ